ncbi:MAG: hypothetical protein ACLVBP_03570 [Ruminococcus sp.]
MDLEQIAQTTAGFTGADLENLLNEAAITAAKRSNVHLLQQNDIQECIYQSGHRCREEEPCYFREGEEDHCLP